MLVLVSVLSKLIPISSLTGLDFYLKKKKSVILWFKLLSLSQKLYPKAVGESFLANSHCNIVDVPTKQIVN